MHYVSLEEVSSFRQMAFTSAFINILIDQLEQVFIGSHLIYI